MPRHRIGRVFMGRAFMSATACVLAISMNTAAARAADFDTAAPAAPPRGIATQRGCRLIPQPQLNLWGEVTTFLPTWVCVSRGVYADTLPPPPPPPPLGLLW